MSMCTPGDTFCWHTRRWYCTHSTYSQEIASGRWKVRGTKYVCWCGVPVARAGSDCHDVLTLFGYRPRTLASQTTTNSAATPGHRGQPWAFLQSQDEQEREVGNRQWKSKHPSQLRHRDERAAETPVVIVLAACFIHVSFVSFAFLSCFIRFIGFIHD